ncbi:MULTISPECIES: helix-turn-helix domain-containing protein [unclassified Sphingobacterium]|uniref:AraC family transcriptional regulator n=1 Tax=unclassified Sphingobacterium TaxID=2609468 RepID=UPI00104609B0|nr:MULTISPECIES: helix-turn-helix domain-containing protein [unclassified Sphingobacterium]MCS3556909.1 AraC-like DNA-binding protein [Sphingobacterium sp. JUb21]TCQ98914.1 AraC-like DNA-binding protein [Sphingobacterium sp. JUb20]
MIREYNDNATAARFVMHSDNKLFSGMGLRNPAPYPINTFIYNKGEAQEVIIDEITYTIPARCILPLVSNQHFVFKHPETLTAWQFNREFYCIVDHDTEVGCVGFLFYGIRHPMFITLNEEESEEMNHLEKVFANELMLKDNFQGEMLRTLLKRVIIKTTRIAKLQSESYQQLPDEKMDVVRKFALILEGNFRQEHEVKFYAAALNKSPKTLSNVFALLKQPAPSVLIHNRIILEAKRYLHYTEKSAKEISYELGFENPAHFSRFFKMYSGTNISDFKSLL